MKYLSTVKKKSQNNLRKINKYVIMYNAIKVEIRKKKHGRVFKPSKRFVSKIKLERMSRKLVQIVQQFSWVTSSYSVKFFSSFMINEV